MIIAGLFALLLVNFTGCTKIPFEFQEKFEALSKRQTSSHSTTKTGVRYVRLNVHYCQPTSVPVKVPPPAVWPSYVKLPRCIGAVYNVDTFECGVTQEAHFRLNASIRLDNGGIIPGSVPLTNHTACGVQCIVKKKDCNNATHTLDQKSCQCNCRKNAPCPSGKVWDENSCKCKCNQIVPCTGYEDVKEWSDKSCTCECQDRSVKKCQAIRKVIDPTDCKCA